MGWPKRNALSTGDLGGEDSRGDDEAWRSLEDFEEELSLLENEVGLVMLYANERSRWL